MAAISAWERSLAWSIDSINDYITRRVLLGADACSVLGGRARGIGVPGSRFKFEMPAGTGIRRSYGGVEERRGRRRDLNFRAIQGTCSPSLRRTWVAAAAMLGAAGDGTVVRHVAGRRIGGAVARASMAALIAANSLLPVQSL